MRSLEYFGDGNVKRAISADAAAERYSYNPHGWLVQRIDRRGVTTTYSYDTVGRLTGKTYSDGTPGVSLTYDLAGRLETATNGADSLRWTYDLAGQPLTEASTRAGTTVTYTYGLLGERRSLSLNGTLLGGYFYDDDGRMTTVSSGAGDFGLEYDAASRRRTLVHPNGVVTEYGYDDLSRLTSVVAHQPAATIASHGYSYDSAGNRTSKTSLDLAETYGYDAVDRLKTITRSGEEGTHVLGYDRVGNRLVTQADGDVQGASYNVRNQLTSISGGGTLLFKGTLDEPGVAAVNGRPARMVTDRVFEADVAVTPGLNTVTVEAWDVAGNKKTERFSITQPATSATFQYDANGNLEEEVEDGHVLGFGWNAENELTRVTRDGVEVARFLYDPLGRRVQKVAGGITYAYTYDGQDILKETHSDGTVYTYVHGPGIDEPLARLDQTNAVAYYHADGLGSIVRTTNAVGNAVETKQYDAWGKLEAGADQPGYAFTGREWDPETGLYYYRARYYDPKIGGFISEDPIGFAGGRNFYSYVGNAPTNAIDPLGLIRFVLKGDWGMGAANYADYAAAYAQMARLRSTLTQDVKDYFGKGLGVDIDQLLMPGGDYIVELARGGADNALGVCKTARDKPTLNLDAAFADGADPDLFNAALLHELAHSFTYKNGFPEGYPFSAGALASAAAGPERGKEGFFAEYYQYGRRLTYGGGR